MSWAGRVTISHPSADHRLPIVVEPALKEPLANFTGEYRDELRECLLQSGAILFRGFDVPTPSDFSAFADRISARRLDYVYRSTPRTTVENKVFTATIYPADREIPLHNENSYQHDWPMQISFYCAVPAATGGETPIADIRRVTQRLSDILDRFEEDQVRYVRNYGGGVDLPWEEVFQTHDRGIVEQYCAEHQIDFDWISTSELRTSQISQGVAVHPRTGERLFFNQAHLFHVSSLGTEMAKTMLDVFGADRLPRNAFFGDGRAIGDHDLTRIRNAFAAEAVVFAWQAGDVLLLDNMQVAHGRRPYSGRREVLVTLSDPYSAIGPRGG